MARLGQLDSLNAQQATSLTAAVSALPFRDELKQQLSQAVSDTLLRPPRRNPQRDLQEHVTFHNFLSVRDREVLADAATHYEDKLDTLACRCVKIGLYYPTEQTSGRVVATGVAAGMTVESHAQFLERVVAFKRKLKAKRGRVAGRYELRLPMTPQQLPASTYQEAYGSDPVGEAVSEAEIGRIMDDAGALTKSNKAVKQARGRQAEAAPPMQLAVPDPAMMLPGGASSSSAGPGADMARQMQMMAMMFQFFQQQQQQQQGQQAQQQAEERPRGVQFSMPAQPAAKRAKALKDAGAAELEDVTPTKDVGDIALQNQSSNDCLDDSQPPSSVKAPCSVKAPSSTSLLEVPGITPEQRARVRRNGQLPASLAPSPRRRRKARPRLRRRPRQRLSRRPKARRRAAESSG